MEPQETIIGEYTYSVAQDDRGRIVAEVWHTESGKTLAIEECDTTADAKHWAKKLIEMRTVPQS